MQQCCRELYLNSLVRCCWILMNGKRFTVQSMTRPIPRPDLPGFDRPSDGLHALEDFWTARVTENLGLPCYGKAFNI